MAGVFTYEQGVVLDQLGAVLIVDAAGRFYAAVGDSSPAVLYDSNGNQIQTLPVTNSVYPPFRADVQTGFLDFGTGVRLPVKSVEYQDAGPQAAAAQAAAEASAQYAANSAQAAAAAAANGGGGGGGSVTDHGLLAGLGDDDHPQYLTTARGDARYDTQAAAATKVATAVSTASTADRNRANHSGVQLQSSIDGLAAALVARPQRVIVVTGQEARPAGSQSVDWVDTRTGTPARPVNMQAAVDVWLSPKAP